jgi:hypothetical protein
MTPEPTLDGTVRVLNEAMELHTLVEELEA